MISAFDNLAASIFRHLRQMDAEATNWTFYDGQEFPTGLYAYDKHLAPTNHNGTAKPKYRSEDAVTEELSHRLHAEGYSIQPDKPKYPNSDQFGDLLIEKDDIRYFLEHKRIQPYDRYKPEKFIRNRNYEKYFWTTDRKVKDHSVSLDFLKLAQLTRSFADACAMLLVGFDADHDRFRIENSDLNRALDNGNFNKYIWHTYQDEWPDVHRSSELDKLRHRKDWAFRVRVWLWIRPVA